MKQVLLIRKDLKMSRGKEIAQACHATMKAYFYFLHDARMKEWLSGQFTKVALVVDSEEELLDLFYKAKSEGMICSLITDSGKTYFHGEPTNTVVAIGPDTYENIDKITGHLKLR